MRAFELHRPPGLAEAIDLLAVHGTRGRPVAGGTDLVAGVMRDQIVGKGMPYPSHLVDVAGLSELRGIRAEADAAVIGASTTLLEIGESPELQDGWPLLVDAAAQVASPEIRALGTLGGNIHQRPRCWFFRNRDFDCAKKGGDICYAVKGDNRYNAILGGNLCFIVHPSDLATALLALGAFGRVSSRTGDRTIAFDDYFIGPDEDILRENVLAPDELLTDVIVPRPAPGARQAWEKLNEKGAPTWDFALASAAVVLDERDGVWTSGRIVLGGVAPVPWRASIVEEMLAGNDIRTALPDAIDALRRETRPMGGNGYKVDLVAHVLERAVMRAVDGQGAVPS